MSVRRTLIGCISCVAVSVAALAASAADEPTLDNLRKMQSDRAAAVHTLHAKWKQCYTVMNDSHHDNYPKLPVSLKGTGELTMSGDNERVVLDRELWHADKQRKVRDTEITVRKKNSIKIYNPIQRQVTIYQKGSEPLPPKCMELIVAAFAPSPVYFSDPKFTLLRRQPSDDKNGLYVVGNTGDTGADLPGVVQGEEYYLDPAKDFVPVRYVYIAAGRVSEDVQIEYKRNSKYGWVPKRLTMTSANRMTGLLEYKRVLEIGRFSINQAVDGKTFDPIFPPGTQVDDRARKTEYNVEATATADTADPVVR